MLGHGHPPWLVCSPALEMGGSSLGGLNLFPLVRVATVGFRKGCVHSHWCYPYGMLSWGLQQAEGWERDEIPTSAASRAPIASVCCVSAMHLELLYL